MRRKRWKGWGFTQDHDQVFKVSRWSTYQWNKQLHDLPHIKRLFDNGRQKIHSFPRFMRELFHRLYSYDAERVDEMRPEDVWAVRAHEEINNLPDFETLRRKCVGQAYVSAEATHALAEHIYNNLPDPPSAMDPQDVRDQINGLMDMAKEVGRENDDDVQQQLEAMRQQGKDLVEEYKKYSKDLSDTDLRNILRDALIAGHSAADDVEETTAAFCGWGNTTGTPDNTPPEVKAALAKKIRSNNKLQRLAKIAGRMRRMAAQKQKSKVRPHRSEISDIECGNDFARLLPSEMVKLNDPVLQVDFMRAYQERSLLQYKLIGREKQGRGPVVILVDNSYSMEGSPEIWAKGIALALVQIAAQHKRSARVIHFESSVRQVDDWPQGKVDPMKLLQSMLPFYKGGTEFEAPLYRALEAIKEDEYKKADVIFITDGECDVSDEFVEEWQRRKAEKEFTCYGVHIGHQVRGLEKFCDKIVKVSNFADDSEVTDTVFDI
jgi:uncharacterized protein with von Willebrand factor type A (vWA) domain